MTPILYKKTANKAETATTNGLGFLTECVKCEITEERNGVFEAELQYPTTGRLYSELVNGAIFKATAADGGNPQLFRIYKVGKTINGITTYNAEHISYDLINLPVNGLTVRDTTAQAAMRAALNMCPLSHEFEAYSDIKTPNTTEVVTPCGIRSMLGGIEGSILDTWGGEFEFDNFDVHLWAHRGENRGVILRYGKNLTDFKQEENIANCYTHVFPYAIRTKTTTTEDGQAGEEEAEKITLPENVIELPTSSVGHTRVLMLDLSGEFEQEEEYTADALREKAEAYIKEYGLTAPEVNISVSFVALWQTEEYKGIAALERVKLCDEVSVYFEPLGVKASAKVVKTVYDALSERYSSIELGTPKANFADTVKSITQSVTAAKAAAENTFARLLVEAGRITAEVSRATRSEEQITSLISQSADEILMSVSETYATKTAGETRSFAYSLTASGATFTANGKKVLEITKDGLFCAGRIEATTGKIGGLTITENYIYSELTSMSGQNEGLYIGPDGINVGGGFIVGKDGNVNITKGKIKVGGTSTDGSQYTSINIDGIYTIFEYDYAPGYGKAQSTITLNHGRLHLSCRDDGLQSRGMTTIDIGADDDLVGYAIKALHALQLSATDNIFGASIHLRYADDSGRSYIDIYADVGRLFGTWTLSSGDAITSDENRKNTIEDLDERYSSIFDALRPRRFKYNDGTSGRFHTGFIAQEVEKAILAAGLTTKEMAAFERDSEGVCALRYSELIALCVMKIQALEKKLAKRAEE